MTGRAIVGQEEVERIAGAGDGWSERSDLGAVDDADAADAKPLLQQRDLAPQARHRHAEQEQKRTDDEGGGDDYSRNGCVEFIVAARWSDASRAQVVATAWT